MLPSSLVFAILQYILYIEQKNKANKNNPICKIKKIKNQNSLFFPSQYKIPFNSLKRVAFGQAFFQNRL